MDAEVQIAADFGRVRQGRPSRAVGGEIGVTDNFPFQQAGENGKTLLIVLQQPSSPGLGRKWLRVTGTVSVQDGLIINSGQTFQIGLHGFSYLQRSHTPFSSIEIIISYRLLAGKGGLSGSLFKLSVDG